MAQSSFTMNGGNGKYSYTNNSTLQGGVASAMKNAIEVAVTDNLDIEKWLFCSSSSSSSNKFVIADLGCSVGPNTFYAMQTLMDAVQHKYNQKSIDNLEFQVFFNDQIGNDFNTLFASLPQPRNYFAVGVPGSFNTRLFPSSSIHIAYSSSSIQWLSKVPEGLQARESLSWNAGRIHYRGASDVVVNAYVDQFEEDMEAFLRARAQELVGGGLVVILMPAVPRRNAQHHATISYTFIQSIFMDLVKEGVIEEERVDSFNIPIYFPCIEDIRSVVDENGCFEIVKMEMVSLMSNFDGMADYEMSVLKHIRAALEGSIHKHFGDGIVEQVFERSMQHKIEFSRILRSSSEIRAADLLFAIFKRK